MVSHSAKAAKHPRIFEEFFGLGREESASPFLTDSARRWAINLTLKSAAAAAFLLLTALTLSLFPTLLPLSNLLLVAVYFLAGVPALIEAVEDLMSGEVNIDILMTLAAFSSVLIGSPMEGGLLLVLFALSGSIEDSVTAKAKGSLNALHKLSPSKACVITKAGQLIERSVRDIPIDTLILIKAGEVVPLDGVVIEGASSVNLAHLTGESVPMTKKVGDFIPSGAMNLEGAVTLQVTQIQANSTLMKIVQLVTEAQEAKPKLQQRFDQFSRAYAVTIISLTALFAVTFPYLLQIPFLGYEGSIYRSLAFLIAASPCALILAVPIAYLSAISACAKQGILLKGGVVLDALASCSLIAFDKTGTLTTGELRCAGIEEIGSTSPNTSAALSAAYSLERNAVHPIAKAILSYAEKKGVKTLSIKEFQSIPGYGLQGIVTVPNGEVTDYTDKQVASAQFLKTFIGNADYLLPKLSQTQKHLLEAKMAEIYAAGELFAAMLMGDRLFLFRFEDDIRTGMKETLERLHKEGRWNLLMLSGDHKASVTATAALLGFNEYYADLRPESKLDHVTRLSKEKGLVMIGDGVNDAPALARATVGICMGKVGSGAAIEAAEVILLHDNLEQLPWLMKKARQTQAIVKQNLIIAIGAIGLAAIPALAGIVPLWLAVVMHEGGTVLVGLNALRLLSRSQKPADAKSRQF
jgi:Zn2+/Cd2+-exporting ATPase